MDRTIDIGDDIEPAASVPVAGAAFLAMREVLSAFRALIVDRAALRLGCLATLRQMASILIRALSFVVRFTIRRHPPGYDMAASGAHALQHLRHPPQAWAAP